MYVLIIRKTIMSRHLLMCGNVNGIWNHGIWNNVDAYMESSHASLKECLWRREQS